VRLFVVAAALAAPAAADVVPEIRVTSEFVAKGPGREILSPAVPRNGWSSFHVTVNAPAGTDFSLHIAQNPDSFVRAELYRDSHRVPAPYDGKIPDDATSVTFWLDVFVPADAEVRRFKLEPQAHTALSGWIVYPMEVRVMEAKVPGNVGQDFPSPPDARDFAANLLCGAKRKLSRNLEQDWRLATRVPRETVERRFKSVLGIQDAAAWCEAPAFPENPEWYLGFRDFLLGQAKYRPLLD
jgi:hypothetical protein